MLTDYAILSNPNPLSGTSSTWPSFWVLVCFGIFVLMQTMLAQVADKFKDHRTFQVQHDAFVDRLSLFPVGSVLLLFVVFCFPAATAQRIHVLSRCRTVFVRSWMNTASSWWQLNCFLGLCADVWNIFNIRYLKSGTTRFASFRFFVFESWDWSNLISNLLSSKRMSCWTVIISSSADFVPFRETGPKETQLAILVPSLLFFLNTALNCSDEQLLFSAMQFSYFFFVKVLIFRCYAFVFGSVFWQTKFVSSMC